MLKCSKSTLAVMVIAWASPCLADSLYDLVAQCTDDSDLSVFIEDVLETSGDPRNSPVAQHIVGNPENHAGKAGNAYRKLQIVKEFFETEANWVSVDDENSPVYLLANMGESNPQGCHGLNAFFLTYEGINLMGVLFGHVYSREDLANDIEVIGHEFGHGIFAATQPNAHIRDAELGGINEGIADMLGVTVRAWYQSGQRLDQAAVRGDSFLVGQTFARIATEYYGMVFEGGAMRNNLNPTIDGRTRDHYDELTDEVHDNSGIVSLPYALLVKGGSHPTRTDGIEVQGIGFEKAFRILFYTLEHHLPYNTMPEFAGAMQRAAARLYGGDSLEWRSTTAAFVTTGLINDAEDEKSSQGSSEPEPEPEPEPPPEPMPEQVPEPPEPELEPEPEPELEPPPEPMPEQEPEPPEPEPEPEPEAEPSEPELVPPEPQLDQQPEPAVAISISGPNLLLILGLALSSLMGFAVLLTRRRRAEIGRVYKDQAKVPAEVVRLRAARPTNSAEKPLAQPTVRLKNDTLAFRIVVNGGTYSAKLGKTPLVIGRGADQSLSENLQRELARDRKISRQHLELWYRGTTRMLYIRCLSRNGAVVAAERVRPGEKVKVGVNHPLDIMLGDTCIKLIFRG